VPTRLDHARRYWDRHWESRGIVASKTVVEWVDDLDGAPAEETVSFSLDGVEYEIDLSTENATKLRARLKEFIRRARPDGTAARRTVEHLERAQRVERVVEEPAPAPVTALDATRSRPAPRSAIKSAHRISATQLTMDVDTFDEPPAATPAPAKAAPKRAAKTAAAKATVARSSTAKTATTTASVPAKPAPAKSEPQPVKPEPVKPAATPEPAKPEVAKSAPVKAAEKPEPAKTAPKATPTKAAVPATAPAPVTKPEPAKPAQQQAKEPAADQPAKVPTPFSQPALPGFTSTPPKEETTAPSRPPMITFTSAKPQ
jgi:hypothetical protein